MIECHKVELCISSYNKMVQTETRTKQEQTSCELNLLLIVSSFLACMVFVSKAMALMSSKHGNDLFMRKIPHKILL